MITRKFKSEPIKENPHKVDVRKLYDSEYAQMMHITLQPGESLKPHKTPVDAIFYVLEGSPCIHIAEETLVCEKDTLIESPAKILHYISNESKSIARILVTKTPRPETTTKLL